MKKILLVLPVLLWPGMVCAQQKPKEQKKPPVHEEDKAPSTAPPWTGILKPVTDAACVPSLTAPSPCAVDWSLSGIPGGIPSNTWMQVRTLTPSGGDDQPKIQAALNACRGTSASSGHVVLLGVGTFQLSSGGLAIPQYCALRGMGADKTVLNVTAKTGNAVSLGKGGPYYRFANGGQIPIASGALAGTSSFTVAAANIGSFKVGALISVDQLNTTYVSARGSSGNCSWCDNGLGGSRTQGVTVPVTAVDKKTDTVTVGDTFPVSFTQSPMAVLMNAGPIATQYAGLEDLQIYGNKTLRKATFLMVNCLYCWVRGIEINYADVAHGEISWSYGFVVRDSYFSNGFIHSPTSSAPEMSVQVDYRSTRGLIENNIFERLHNDIMLESGASENVIAYNYGIGDYGDYTQSRNSGDPYVSWGVLAHHGAFPMYNLAEGNVGSFLGHDAIWGNMGWETAFRNYLRGTDRICMPVTSTREPVTCTPFGQPPPVPFPNTTGINSWWKFQGISAFAPGFSAMDWNMVGNVLGSSDLNSLVDYANRKIPVTDRVWAVCGGSAGTPCGANSRCYYCTPNQAFVYNFGYGNMSDSGTQNNASCSSTVPFGNAANNCDSQAPWNTFYEEGDFDFIANTTRWVNNTPVSLPPSFYLSAKPSWWGTLPWPGIGPDVSGGVPGSGGHADNNPAKNCYEHTMGGSIYGSERSPLPFNAMACYSGGQHPLVSSPTNLTVVVQ